MPLPIAGYFLVRVILLKVGIEAPDWLLRLWAYILFAGVIVTSFIIWRWLYGKWKHEPPDYRPWQ